MARFIRASDEQDRERDQVAPSGEHPELVALVQAYSRPLEPDPTSALSVRDQHLTGIVRPRRIRDVAWNRRA